MEVQNKDFEIYGRKIFFLNPAYAIKKEVIQNLRKNEYEVYLIETYRDAKNLLRKNPGSLLFINVDAQLTIPAWFNFIRSFEREEALKSIYVTVISEKLKSNDVEIFCKFSEMEEGYGVIDFSKGVKDVANRIQNILDAKNAKGRRQYIRANMMSDKEVSLFWNYGSKMHKLKLYDLSSVGMAVKIPVALENMIIAKNFLLQDVTMQLGTKQLAIEAVIFTMKKTPEGTIWVLLLAPFTPSIVKDEIRQYIFRSIEDQLFISINEDRKDDMDYSKMSYYNLATKTRDKKDLSPFSHQPGHNFS